MATWRRPDPIRIPTEEDLDPEVREQIEEFNRDRERVRLALRRLGGRENDLAGKIANGLFIGGLLLLLIVHFGLDLVGDMLSLELGLLLLSLKILWMMRAQERQQHFLFWMLHSLEFRQNEILERLDRIKRG